MRTKYRIMLIAALALITAAGAALAGCSTPPSNTGGGTPAATPLKIALLLPETKTTRYDSQDKPLFEQRMKELDPSVQIIYSNANQDAAQQQSQADAALTNGAKVLVLDPVDSASAGAIVTKAKAAGVPVVSYDRLITNAPIDYYISFDNVQVGKLQATALLSKIGTSPKKTIVMINGAPTDNNAKLFKQGAHSVLDGKVKIGAEYDTPDWSPDQAQTEMDEAITKLGKTGFQGVYCANDGTAGGAIAAMMGAGINPLTRPTTGQDAQLDGIQRILLGQQYMTVYKAIKPEAYDAAELAYSLAKGTSLPASITVTSVNNGLADIKSVILTPVAVTASNIKDTVVADGFWTTAQILTSPALKAAGAKVGLQ